jgi:hypothetical protein
MRNTVANMFRITLVALLLLPSIGFAQSKPSTEDADIARFLTATKFVSFMKQGVRDSGNGHAHPSAIVSKVMKLPDDRVIAAVTPIFHKELSPEEAKEVADFYASSTGQAVVTQEYANVGKLKPPLALTSAQREQIIRFAMSPGGEAASRLNRLEQTEEFIRKVSIAVVAEARR